MCVKLEKREKESATSNLPIGFSSLTILMKSSVKLVNYILGTLIFWINKDALTITHKVNIPLK
ncbi:MAG: hypothetical protein ACRD8Z_13180 [Nitrososphaeraceae archaeon]